MLLQTVGPTPNLFMSCDGDDAECLTCADGYQLIGQQLIAICERGKWVLCRAGTHIHIGLAIRRTTSNILLSQQHMLIMITIDLTS